MTDTKQKLQEERAQLVSRSAQLASELKEVVQTTGNNHIDNVSSRLHSEIRRHKESVDQTIYIIEMRIRLMDVYAETFESEKKAAEAALQEQQAVE